MADGPAPGATPLSEEEKEELIPTHVATREQLNEWEQLNILEADRWAFSRRRSDVLSLGFLRELHRRMFDRTWRWAGRFRTTGKNIGVPEHLIETSLQNACDDARFWIENEVFAPAEIAARYHHRVVYVHPFPNGNGRHARLAADALLHNLGHARLRWGGGAPHTEGSARDRYISALRAADEGDYDPLLRFLGLEPASG